MADVISPAAAKDDDESFAVGYLRNHPGLLARYPDLLESLELSHTAGSAVSLIERQVEVLRGKNARLEDRMSRLLDTARENERRASAVLQLARDLIRAPSLGAVAMAVRCSMDADFSVDAVFIGLTLRSFSRHDIDGIVPLRPGHPLLKTYQNFFRTRLIECGPIPESTSKLLFPDSAELMRSAAIVPLEKQKTLGLMALGSVRPDRFKPRQGKLFLEMIADLIAVAIRTRLK